MYIHVLLQKRKEMCRMKKKCLSNIYMLNTKLINVSQHNKTASVVIFSNRSHFHCYPEIFLKSALFCIPMR